MINFHKVNAYSHREISTETSLTESKLIESLLILTESVLIVTELVFILTER